MLLLTIGLPGSGKSALLKRLGLPRPDMAVVTPDRIRWEFFGVTFDPAVEPEVWTVVRAAVRGNLRRGRSVALDATNLTRAWRSGWLRLARRYGHPVVGVHFDLSLKQVRKQNRMRVPEWVVPEAVIAEMARMLEPPTEAEGFQAVVTIRGGLDDGAVRRVQEAMVRVDGRRR